MDPIKYIFEKPTLIGKISYRQMLLSKFDIVFVMRKAIKGQASQLPSGLAIERSRIFSIPEGPANPCFSQAKFWLHQQRHRLHGVHSRPISYLRVRCVWSKCLWRFPIDYHPNRGKVVSPRHQVDSVSEVRQPSNPKVSKHHLCLFAQST